jgi:hypothetical protein
MSFLKRLFHFQGERIMLNKNWICWLGAISSIVILLIIAHLGKNEDVVDLLLVLALGLLPAFITIFTSVAEYFWPNLIIGFWFLFWGLFFAGDIDGTIMMVELLAALFLASTPILKMIFAKKKSMV